MGKHSKLRCCSVSPSFGQKHCGMQAVFFSCSKGWRGRGKRENRSKLVFKVCSGMIHDHVSLSMV